MIKYLIFTPDSSKQNQRCSILHKIEYHDYLYERIHVCQTWSNHMWNMAIESAHITPVCITVILQHKPFDLKLTKHLCVRFYLSSEIPIFRMSKTQACPPGRRGLVISMIRTNLSNSPIW